MQPPHSSSKIPRAALARQSRQSGLFHTSISEACFRLPKIHTGHRVFLRTLECLCLVSRRFRWRRNHRHLVEKARFIVLLSIPPHTVSGQPQSLWSPGYARSRMLDKTACLANPS